MTLEFDGSKRECRKNLELVNQNFFDKNDMIRNFYNLSEIIDKKKK